MFSRLGSSTFRRNWKAWTAAVGTTSLFISSYPALCDSANFPGKFPNGGPKFTVHSQITQQDLPKMTDDESMRKSKTFFKDFAYSNVEGKELASGLFRMLSGPALEYTYTYEEMKYIVEGEFHLTDGTGQKAVARAGDLVYFPAGCRVKFETPHYALGCFTGQRKQDEVVGDAKGLPNSKFTVHSQITQKKLPKMTDDESMRQSNTFFQDFAISEVEGKELASGLFRMINGPALEYTYSYEEMKYIVEGEFHLTDGTGQKVIARAGDLVYFPAGCQVKFETPHYALGCFTGQRKLGEE